MDSPDEIDDIEDLCEAVTRSQIVGKDIPVVKRDNTARWDFKVESFVPGTKSIYLKTWGCAHNNSDSEYMAGLLHESGYQITDDKEHADLWLLNSCTVKSPAESRFRNNIEEAMIKRKFLVLAGCVPQSSPNAHYLEGFSAIGVQQIDRVVEVVELTLQGNCVQLTGTKRKAGKKLGGPSLQLPKIRKNPLIEIIPINTGCLNHCTYCKTKQARGNLGSYPTSEIVKRAIQVFTEGVKEIWLTSEDTGAYGRDIGETLPHMLRSVLEIVPEGCMMRLGMTNPPYILDYLEDIGDILNHPRVYSFLHIPVQSGSDYVLADMKRDYCINDFKSIVYFLKERVPGITIATDIICGFPTESDLDFDDTFRLIEEFKFPVVFINQFFPRPNTPAARMPLIPTNEVKERSRQLSKLFRSYPNYEDKLWTVQNVLVTEVASDKIHFVGHTKFYEQVLVPCDEKLMGQFVNVFITRVGKHFMMGDPIEVEAKAVALNNRADHVFNIIINMYDGFVRTLKGLVSKLWH